MCSDRLNELVGFEVEKVRASAEKQLATALDRFPQYKSTYVEQFEPDKVRRRLLSRAIRLSEKMAPKVCDLATETERVLGLEKPIDLYQSAGVFHGMSDEGNAAIHYLEDSISIEIIGKWVLTLDDRTMLAVLGHEVGHYLAHHPSTRYGLALRRCQRLYEPAFFGAFVRSFKLATELTADRFGLLACQDLDAALRLEMVSTTGLPESALDWDTRAYLDQCREVMESSLSQGEQVEGYSHPEHNMRAYAVWLYSETDEYCLLTGQEPEGRFRKLDEVDATLNKLLGVPQEPQRRFGRRRKFAAGAGKGQPKPDDRETSDSPTGSEVDDRTNPEAPKYPASREEKAREIGRKSERALGKAAQALGQAAKNVKPGLSRVSKGAGAGVARLLGRKSHSGASEPTMELDDDIDPLKDDEDELLDRFAKLEQQMTSDDDLPPSELDDMDDMKQRFAELERQSASKPAEDDLDDDAALLARLAALEKQMK